MRRGTRKKQPVDAGRIRARVYPLMTETVEAGIAYGLQRADKHADDVLTDAQRARVLDQVHLAVMDAICERFEFEDDCPSS